MPKGEISAAVIVKEAAAYIKDYGSEEPEEESQSELGFDSRDAENKISKSPTLG